MVGALSGVGPKATASKRLPSATMTPRALTQENAVMSDRRSPWLYIQKKNNNAADKDSVNPIEQVNERGADTGTRRSSAFEGSATQPHFCHRICRASSGTAALGLLGMTRIE